MIEYSVVLECIIAWLFLCAVTILSLHLWLAFPVLQHIFEEING